MKYYIIVGEASGDLHASHLMAYLKKYDKDAQFRFIGGDMMAKEGGTQLKHYKDLAYMGIVPVLLHLRTIFSMMSFCKKDILSFDPSVVILVDYPGFNLKVAKFVKTKTQIPVYYYISPKIWAWKEYRIKNIKRDVAELFSILPFEVPFYEKKHGYPVHYIGNPTAEEILDFKQKYSETWEEFCSSNNLSSKKHIIALLSGSRKQEIKDNLPAMIEAASRYTDNYQLVIAGAPAIAKEYYEKFILGKPVKIIYDKTYSLLANSYAALVTSGTATLETGLFGVPQVVCYETPIPKVIALARKILIKVKYISLINLIADKEIVKELVADTFTVENIADELGKIITEGEFRDKIIEGYKEVSKALGDGCAPKNAAKIMVELLQNKTE
ncbi:MAG: lipid-A-disaccharide synthase [Prevotella sp.]|nr:lipid-A-disaccharide synthase [Prevotella sp.]